MQEETVTNDTSVDASPTPYNTCTGQQVWPAMCLNLLAAFLAATSPHVIEPIAHSIELLQPNTNMDIEPHLVAMMLSFVASSDLDTMTLSEAMKQPDQGEFLKVMEKELADRIGQKHWKVVPVKVVPRHMQAIPMVCQTIGNWFKT